MLASRSSICAVLCIWLTACVTGQGSSVLPPGFTRDADDLAIVDCLLPGQVRQLGRLTQYVTARRPIKATRRDCASAGGEFVLFDSANPRHALALWEPGAQAGDPVAQTFAGELHERSDPPDYARAADWYRKAADQGEARAMINLAHLYEQGLGVERSSAEAARWYAKAAGVDVSIDPGSLANQQARIEQLEREVQRLRLELEQKNRQLQNDTGELGRDREAVEKIRFIWVEKTKRIEILPPELAAEGKRIKEQERDIERREAGLSNLRQDVQRTQGDADRLRRELVSARKVSATGPAAAKGSALAPPSIELIEPPLIATRGLRIAVRSAQTEREVIGRVTAPAGLLSVSVNGQPAKVETTGVFQALVKLTEQRTPVRVLAIDRRGERTTLQFELERALEGAAPPVDVAAPGRDRNPYRDVKFGNYHALVIGNNDYAHVPNLRTAISDARAIAKVLKERYGFRTTVVENVNRYELLSAFNTMRETLTSEDNLLIYYAGHGELDTVNMRGHWLPVDAEETNTANWVSNVAVTDMLNVIEAKQIMLIVDACYSGSLTRSGVPRLASGKTEPEKLAWLKQVAKRRSRTVLTSGGLKPVMDSGGGGHSVFANAVLSVLKANNDVLEGRKLYREVAARVAYAAAKARFDQMPEYAPIRHAGHEAGDFLLFPPGG